MSSKVIVMKVSIFEFLKRCISEKVMYVGYAKGDKSRVYEINVPFLREKWRDRVLLHELVHIKINQGYYDITHKEYDKLTWHGLLQYRFKQPEGEVLMPEWEYGEFDKLTDL